MAETLDADLERAVGERLVAAGKVEPAALERAGKLAHGSSERLFQVLVKLGLVAERDLADAIAAASNLPPIQAEAFPDLPLLDDKLSPRFLREAAILPLADDGETLALAIADPARGYAVDAMRLISGREVALRIATASEIEQAIDRLYGREQQPAEAAEDGDAGLDLDVERLRDLASEAPVIRLVNRTIARAVEMRASDIHIEPFESQLVLRYRVDGVLREMDPLPHGLRAAIASRIKIMARLNIAERRLPQDGRIKLAIRGTPIDLRVSTLPTMHGESIVLRVLDRGSVVLDFAALGIAGDALDGYLKALEHPNGIFLVTGPTGSGKTTTLYASLVRLNQPDRKIITVEDPIEYQLGGVNQVQVKPGIGLDFAHVLRSILRQDPDIILIGEIRDLETAQIAVQAALTGHLVLSTLHTNDAASTVTRLLDMGLDDYLLTATVNGVAAQRLVRVLCPECREPHAALPELVEQLRLRRYVGDGEVTLYRPRGCDRCNHSGFRGRTSIVEVLALSDPIRKLVLQRAESRDIQRAAVEAGMRTMFDHGMAKALAGETSVEEVLRVTREG